MIQSPPEPAQIWQKLAAILDPEFGINIVDMGLIYSVDSENASVHVVMTLTTPACPSGSWIYDGVEQAVRAIPGVESVKVDMVFEPMWTPDMISEEGRRELGWGGK